jgi:F-type H+-transporting ATPase subunit b
MIFKLINFAIFAGILAYFLKKPAKEFWLKRHVSIGDCIAAAKNSYDRVCKEEFSINERLKNVGREKIDLINELKKEGALERTKLIELATKYGEELKKDAGLSMKYEIERAISDIKKQIAGEVIELVSQRLAKETTEDDYKKAMNSSLGEIEAGL